MAIGVPTLPACPATSGTALHVGHRLVQRLGENGSVALHAGEDEAIFERELAAADFVFKLFLLVFLEEEFVCVGSVGQLLKCRLPSTALIALFVLVSFSCSSHRV
jgi:hypothetical protein